MKTRLLLIIAISAIATLSFSFSLTNKAETPQREAASSKSQTEPIGGFLSEDKF